jgi:hypothetical protein
MTCRVTCCHWGSRSVIGATHSSSVLITPQRSEAGGKRAGAQPPPASPPPPLAPPKSLQAEIKPPAGPAAEAQKPIGGVVPLQQAAANQGKKDPVLPISAGKGAAVSLQAPVNRMQSGGFGLGALAGGGESAKPARPVLTPVRMATPTEPINLKPMAPAAALLRPRAPPSASAGGGSRRSAAVSVSSKGRRAARRAAAAPPRPGAESVLRELRARIRALRSTIPTLVRPKTDQRALYYQL